MFLKSAFNYTGAKYSILEQLFKYFPTDTEVLYDIFCGGGSVFINSNYKEIIANDKITPLMDFYIELKNNKWSDILSNLKPYILDKTDKLAYNVSRAEFNTKQNPYQFFSLIQSCTNNMMRFNKKMEFNQTWGNRSYGKKTEEKLFNYWSKLQTINVQFFNKNYIELLPMILNDTRNPFIYLDPPYYGITTAGYNNQWSKLYEEELISFLNILNENNIKFAMSGVSIHKGIENPFIKQLSKYKILNIDNSYEKIARNKNAGESQEILIINY